MCLSDSRFESRYSRSRSADFFGSSSALAGAYGIAVTLTMMITTVLTYFVVRAGWGLPRPLAAGATAFFLAFDALLVAGCAVKFFDGATLLGQASLTATGADLTVSTFTVGAHSITAQFVPASESLYSKA